MIQDNNTTQPGKNETNENNGQFESDTQKIVRRHLENEDHKITDEEMANIRVGMKPPELDEPTQARLQGEDAVDDVEEKILKNRNIEEDENTRGDKLTPWDIKEP